MSTSPRSPRRPVASRPSVVVFDVNETLSDMTPMARRFTDVGADGHLARLWFATLLRDGFALTAAGATERFSTLADGALRVLLDETPLERGLDDAIAHIMDGFMGLQVHPDVPDGVRDLTTAGFRLVTLSNGSAEVAERLLGPPASVVISSAVCPSMTPASGSRPPRPMHTPPRSAASARPRWSSSPSIPGTPTAPPGRDFRRRGSIGAEGCTPATSSRPTAPPRESASSPPPWRVSRRTPRARRRRCSARSPARPEAAPGRRGRSSRSCRETRGRRDRDRTGTDRARPSPRPRSGRS